VGIADSRRRYGFVWFDGLNRFFVAGERQETLAQFFRTPPNTFDDFIRATDTEYASRIIAAENEALAAAARAAAAAERTLADEQRAHAAEQMAAAAEHRALAAEQMAAAAEHRAVAAEQVAAAAEHRAVAAAAALKAVHAAGPGASPPHCGPSAHSAPLLAERLLSRLTCTAFAAAPRIRYLESPCSDTSRPQSR